jgi:glycosyltransferase involved in cell wall biosynthesis
VKSLVILPTFNEAENISILIARILKFIPDTDLLVVDGGSTDSTIEIVSGYSTKDSRVHLIQEKKKLGLGKAYLTGFAWGLSRSYSRIIEMDGDLSHRVRDLAKLLEVTGSDLIVGSRWIAGGAIENWSRSREMLSRFANKYVEFILKLGVSDSTSGFRVYTADLLRKIDLESIKSEGYAFQIEMVRAARKAGAKILEIPITFREREFGKSKISRTIVLEAMLRVTYWGLKRN